ncbi:MAG: hypothetical protein Q6365_008770 [Candidatus Sigynarchaeota archaeon]
MAGPGMVTDVVATSAELNTRHVLKILAEMKLDKSERRGLQKDVEEMLGSIDSELIDKIRSRGLVPGKDGKMVPASIPGKDGQPIPAMEYLDARFQFLCSIIQAVNMSLDPYLRELYNEAYDDYIYAQHAPVPADYPYRIDVMLNSFEKIKMIYNRLKQNDEAVIRAQFDGFYRAMELLSARGMEVLESAMGSLIYSPKNIEEFSRKYLRLLSGKRKEKEGPS